MASGQEGEEGGKPKLPLEDLAKEWETDQCIRDHLRQEGMVLFPEKLTESVKSSSLPHIHAVLKPLLLRTAETKGHPQPAVEPLRAELVKIYKRCSVMAPNEAQIIQDSWMIRRFLSLVKVKTRLHKVSSVACLI